MTDYLDEIQSRADAATDGPWGYPFPRKNVITTAAYIDVTEADWGGEGLREYRLGCTEDRNAWRAEDAEFIAHARTDLPRLVAALRAVEALCAAEEGYDPNLVISTSSHHRTPVVPTEWIRTAIRDALEAR